MRRHCRLQSRRLFSIKPSLLNNKYGQFSKEEYEKAAKYVKQQYEQLSSTIKGSKDIRENLGSMPSFPSTERTKGGIRTDSLSAILAETIKTTGPLSLSAYMRQCLTHPEFGYYTTRDPLDAAKGDFITSPEISSMFGEMVGIWLYLCWASQNSPNTIRVVEFGPGRGTLMHDCLQSFSKFTKGRVEVEVVLIEASPVLRKQQHQLLGSGSFQTNDLGFNHSPAKFGTIWWVDTEKDIDRIGTLPPANYVVAHEFFDALPIKSFVRKEGGWRELLVEHTKSVTNTQAALPGEAHSSELLDTEFHLTMAPGETPSSIIPTLNQRYANLPLESRVEICSEAELYLMKMVQLLRGGGGAVLVIDYGPATGVPENSLRGIYKHKFVSPFIKPGEVDLSIDVDFENLAQLLSKAGAQPYGPVEQGDWLHACGIGYRAEQLINSTTDENKQDQIYNAYRRLTDKEQMGSIYKVMCVMPEKSPPPVGFGGSV